MEQQNQQNQPATDQSAPVQPGPVQQIVGPMPDKPLDPPQITEITPHMQFQGLVEASEQQVQQDQPVEATPENAPDQATEQRVPSQTELLDIVTKQQQYIINQQQQLEQLQQPDQSLVQKAATMDKIYQNPELFETVRNAIVKTNEFVPEKLPSRPDKPERPASFSMEEAMAEPTSPSGRYRSQYVDYEEKLNEWQANVVEMQARNSQNERVFYQTRQRQQQQAWQQQEQQRQAHEQRQQHQQQLIQNLQTKHGMSEAEVGRFMGWVQNRENIQDPSVWVNMFRMSEGRPVPGMQTHDTNTMVNPNVVGNRAMYQGSVQQGPQQYPRSVAGAEQRGGQPAAQTHDDPFLSKMFQTMDEEEQLLREGIFKLPN